MKITKIIYDVEYYDGNIEVYTKQIKNKYKYTIKYHLNNKMSGKINTNDESIVNEYRQKFELSHKIRVCQFKFKDRHIELSRDLFNWRKDGSLWGAYNRAYNLNESDMEIQYQKLIRTKKFDRILNFQTDDE